MNQYNFGLIEIILFVGSFSCSSDRMTTEYILDEV
ncbi:hypothetical protein CCDG5_0970 [[Clostridium] cellulosi]|uniref:Uncharacterized protein n=1 Tax=[Clostridium] cellulosi TaxID=29343 RepID=A0A078KSI3_9FIRM|nr:hypothetical protein CCDG5_0970 [[Clostridium] cellulosi]